MAHRSILHAIRYFLNEMKFQNFQNKMLNFFLKYFEFQYFLMWPVKQKLFLWPKILLTVFLVCVQKIGDGCFLEIFFIFLFFSMQSEYPLFVYWRGAFLCNALSRPIQLMYVRAHQHLFKARSSARLVLLLPSTPSPPHACRCHFSWIKQTMLPIDKWFPPSESDIQ